MFRNKFNKRRLTYTENYKTLVWDVKKDLPKWRDIPYLYIEKSIFLWYQISLNWLTVLTHSTLQSQKICLNKNWRAEPKIYKEWQRTKDSWNNFEREGKSWIIYTSQFQNYCKATVSKTECWWCGNRHVDQWDRTEIPGINTYIYGRLIFNKGVKEV